MSLPFLSNIGPASSAASPAGMVGSAAVVPSAGGSGWGWGWTAGGAELLASAASIRPAAAASALKRLSRVRRKAGVSARLQAMARFNQDSVIGTGALAMRFSPSRQMPSSPSSFQGRAPSRSLACNCTSAFWALTRVAAVYRVPPTLTMTASFAPAP